MKTSSKNGFKTALKTTNKKTHLAHETFKRKVRFIYPLRLLNGNL